MGPSRIRVAVFECDQSLDPDRTLYGGYGGLIASWLQRDRQLGQRADITVFDVVGSDDYLALENIDAIVISGSPTSANSDEAWVRRLLKFLEHMFSTLTPCKWIGLCFGHQIIAKALGANIVQASQGFEASNTDITLSRECRGLFGKSTICLKHMHHDNVEACPSGVQNLGWTNFCKVQGLYVPNKLLSVQAHPEFDSETMAKVLSLMHASEELDQTEYQQALLRNSEPTDTDLVLDVIGRFLLD